MKVGDIVKYYFPLPENENKKYIIAIISFASDSRIVLDCEDGTCMMISPKNYEQIEVMRSVDQNENILVA